MGENGGEFANLTPDELIEYQQNTSNNGKYDIVDYLQRFVSQQKGSYNYKERFRNAVRSFFIHNRAELPRDPSFRVRGDKPKTIGTLKADELKDIILSSNPCYQAVFLCMFQGGMGLSELDYWNKNGLTKLKEDLKKDPHIIRIDLPGRKLDRNRRPFYTLIGSDAIKAIENWLQHRPENAKVIFTNNHRRPLTKHAIQAYWLRRIKKLGIVSVLDDASKGTRYGKNPHEIRDLFRSLWEKSPCRVSVAEFMMGHQVDPLEYNKAFRDEKWMLQQYEDALPYLQIISSGKPFGQVKEDEVRELRRKLKELEEEKNQELDDMKSTLEALQKQLALYMMDLERTGMYKVLKRIENQDEITITLVKGKENK